MWLLKSTLDHTEQTKYVARLLPRVRLRARVPSQTVNATKDSSVVRAGRFGGFQTPVYGRVDHPDPWFDTLAALGIWDVNSRLVS